MPESMPKRNTKEESVVRVFPAFIHKKIVCPDFLGSHLHFLSHRNIFLVKCLRVAGRKVNKLTVWRRRQEH